MLAVAEVGHCRADKAKSPPRLGGPFALWVPDNDLLSHGSSVLSSACRRFTVLFGMGRGGSSGLWSSGIEGWKASLWIELRRFRKSQPHSRLSIADRLPIRTHDYGVKPHGQLVPVCSTRYRASTPGLSTWWSATTLQGGQAPGRSHLQACFPLRCFQRLSLPYIATRRCDWRHNWYTSGSSTPVLPDDE